MLREGINAWKLASEELGLKNAKEAIFEFLRIEDKTIVQAQKYLIDFAAELSIEKLPTSIV